MRVIVRIGRKPTKIGNLYQNSIVTNGVTLAQDECSPKHADLSDSFKPFISFRSSYPAKSFQTPRSDWLSDSSWWKFTHGNVFRVANES